MSNAKIKVLYVDDEPVNLDIFKAGFRYNFNVFTADSAEAGLAILRKETIHVIVADQRMPKVTGVEFLASVIKEFPDPIRILLTGYADIEAVIEAINCGQIYRYIKKPWEATELILTIENAYEVYSSRIQLKVTNALLTKTNEELNRFVYSASHDLKAPIMSVLGLLKVAELEGDSKDSDKYFTMIGTSVKQLELFIHNIINYYKNTKILEAKDDIDLKQIIQETLNSYEYIENKSETQIIVNIEQNQIFLSDEFRIRVIFNNLISNAIKYQRKTELNKKILIDCQVATDEAKITVSDNGIGINSVYLENIFKMFYRATRESTGSGIGLYIVKEAVEKVHGTITVESIEGEGTTFKIVIPNKKLLENF